MNTCDIIVPTYNGREKLPLVIAALQKQVIPEGWTVRLIVSDDGSTQPVDLSIAQCVWGNAWLQPIVLNNIHKGRSHARNSAINAAIADIILFLADDILLRPSALFEHLIFHQEHTQKHMAALGCVVWDPRIHPTPLMDWMMHGGQQNDYDSIIGVLTCSAEHYFYGSFLSIKREFLGQERFSDTFYQYGWEDLELGNRLSKKGLTLAVLHRSLAFHRHWYNADEILKRQRIVGSAKYLVNTNIARKIVHGFYGLLGVRALARYFMKKWGDTANFPRLFGIITAGEFWYGVHHSNKLLKSQIH